MKLKIYKHKSLKTKIDDDIVKMQDYFKSDFFRQFIDDTLVVDIEETNKDYMDDTLYKSIEDTHDTAMLIYEQGTFPIYGSAQMYSHKLVKIYVSVNPIEDNIDYSWKVMAHELVHAYWLMTIVKEGKWLPNILDYSSPTSYYKNDQPYATDGNFAQQLKALQPYFKKGYKYFNEKSDPKMIGVNPKLMAILDTIRGECGFPITITSGFRTKEQNKLAGGVADSAHLLGLAVDVNINTGAKRIKFIKSAIKNGITRIGLAETFCHIDIDSSKSDSIWFY
jgi:uncharacterized protein YcbK (DUF882 family)